MNAGPIDYIWYAVRAVFFVLAVVMPIRYFQERIGKWKGIAAGLAVSIITIPLAHVASIILVMGGWMILMSIAGILKALWELVL